MVDRHEEEKFWATKLDLLHQALSETFFVLKNKCLAYFYHYHPSVGSERWWPLLYGSVLFKNSEI